MMTVFVLAVLWLIVVVPMLFRRHDERRREKSVDGFGRSMRALGRRAPAADARAEVFVPSARRAEDRAVSTRRPVPAAQEALMYPVDRFEMSEARAQMMARRRRSLGILGAATVILMPTAFLVGGLMWLVAAPFAVGFVGYLLFLRSQAQRDRDRRHNRQQRAAQRRTRSVDMTAAAPAREPAVASAESDSVVRIDDDDIELHNLDTIDLTGLYNDEVSEAAAQRRAS
jgi:membrane protein implicated in regulation of membrane protease activity